MAAEEQNLFVDADDNMESETDLNIYGESEESDSESLREEEEEDPVVESIPLFMNNVTGPNQTIHLLQYMAKSKNSPFTLQTIGARLKPESNYLLVKLPLDTSKFYDESKAEEWGTHVQEHEHMGVLDKTNGSIYAAKLEQDGSSKKVVLIPVNTTTQLRPSFKYLDDADSLKMQQRREITEPTKPTNQNVHILQSSAKSKNGPVDPLANSSLGESLKHIRKFEQEEWQNVKWTASDDPSTQEVHNRISNPSSESLQTNETMNSYLDKLTQ